MWLSSIVRRKEIADDCQRWRTSQGEMIHIPLPSPHRRSVKEKVCEALEATDIQEFSSHCFLSMMFRLTAQSNSGTLPPHAGCCKGAINLH
jgi:hypothetical protein